jgi:hypothetical protein
MACVNTPMNHINFRGRGHQGGRNSLDVLVHRWGMYPRDSVMSFGSECIWWRCPWWVCGPAAFALMLVQEGRVASGSTDAEIEEVRVSPFALLKPLLQVIATLGRGLTKDRFCETCKWLKDNEPKPCFQNGVSPIDYGIKMLSDRSDLPGFKGRKLTMDELLAFSNILLFIVEGFPAGDCELLTWFGCPSTGVLNHARAHARAHARTLTHFLRESSYFRLLDIRPDHANFFLMVGMVKAAATLTGFTEEHINRRAKLTSSTSTLRATAKMFAKCTLLCRN